jgi:small subunit ribosomal protein S9
MPTKQAKTADKYYEAVGRRKSATARVRLFEDTKSNIVVNDQPADKYFVTSDQQQAVREALTTGEKPATFRVSAHVSGGGLSAQAEAIRHGIARALVEYDETNRPTLKHAGFLKRDPRSKERKKFGRKKARKSAQWSKR